MDRFQTSNNGTMTATVPMFASIWLALFYVLRENLQNRQAPADSNGNEPVRLEAE